MFGLQLVKMILGNTKMSKINENFEKIREFVYMNHLRISLTLMGMFVLAATFSFLTGNFANAAFFLIAAMMFVF